MVGSFKALCLCALTVLLGRVCPAQTPAVPDDTSTTLRVYVNRIQIPVLVLSQYGRPMKPIPASSFRVSLDGLGDVKPSSVRVEGDDPLAVAVIVDASEAFETTWRDLPKSVETLLPAMNPQDRLTLYGLDGCKAFRFLPEDAPLNASLVHAGVERAMTMKAHVAVKGQTDECTRALTMADMITHVALRLKAFAGRRMIVTVGAGTSAGIANRMDGLKGLLNANSIMVLPVIHAPAYAAMPMPYLPHRQGAVGIVNSGFGSTHVALAELSEFSGGRVRYIASHEFGGALAEAVKTARGRYILEFPRPDTLSAGRYRITVTDGNPRDFIRTSGISVPVANGEEIAAARAATAGMVDARAEGIEEQPSASAAPGVVDAGAKDSPAVVPPAVVPAAAVPSAAPAVARPDPTDITGDFAPSR